MNPLSLLGGVGGLASGLYSLFSGLSENREAKQWMNNANNPAFIKSQIPKSIQDMLGLSQNQLNSEMPGYSQAQKDIFTNQANTVGNAERGARGSSSFLSALSGAQGQSNNAFNNLTTQNAQDYQRRLGNLNQAQSQYGNYYYNNYMNDINRSFALKGAGQQSIGNGIGALGGVAGFAGGLMSNPNSFVGNSGQFPTQPLSGQVGYQPLGGYNPGQAQLAGGDLSSIMQFAPLLMGLI